MKLLNKGNRMFTVASGVNWKPMQVMDFPDAIGKNLRELYPNEVHDLEEATKPFLAPAPVEPEEPAKQIPPEPIPEELDARAFAAEAKKRKMTVEELTAKKLEVQEIIHSLNVSQAEAEEAVFGSK